MTTTRHIQEVAASFNRMLAPARAVEGGLASTIPFSGGLAKVMPEVSGVAESAEAAAEWRAETDARDARRFRSSQVIAVAIFVASLVVSIVSAIVK